MIRKKIDGIYLEILKTVYNPAEDSILLAENVVLRKNYKILEIGIGSGFVSIYLAKRHPMCEFFSVDINYFATLTSIKNAKHNSTKLEVINTDLFTSLYTPFQRPLFDVILFNAPYLPEHANDLQSKAWAGGVGGLQIISEFIQQLPYFIKNKGASYLVVSSKTNISIYEQLILKNNFSFKIIDKIVEGGEIIYLYKLKK